MNDLDPSALADFYEDHLRRVVMPFWVDRCMDEEYGGILNCVTDEGERKSDDKYCWSQGRALWTFSALHNLLDHDPVWLHHAHHIAEFLKQSVPPAGEGWPFIWTRDGRVVQPHASIYADSFVMIGMTEYYRATGDEQALDLARDVFRRVSPLLEDHDSFPSAPHDIPPGVQSHGPLMIFALTFHEYGLVAKDEAAIGRSLELADRIMRQHVEPETGLLRELVRPGGEPMDNDIGNTYIPGHAIESMWFLERIYRHHGREEPFETILKVVHWNLEHGWDEEYEGLFLACHLKGGTPVWHQPDAKVWWPHTEALYGLVRAWDITGGAEWCRQWLRTVHDYTFRVFPNHTQGDWYHNLNRRNERIGTVLKGLPVKDPFHLPRALLYCTRDLRRLHQEGQD